MANFSYLADLDDPHLVANYWKHMLREMKNPLIPFEHYELYGALAEIPEQRRPMRIKVLVGKLDTLRRNTLKFCCEFFSELIQYESDNKMTSYNIAVTVGPNIFRPQR